MGVWGELGHCTADGLAWKVQTPNVVVGSFSGGKGYQGLSPLNARTWEHRDSYPHLTVAAGCYLVDMSKKLGSF